MKPIRPISVLAILASALLFGCPPAAKKGQDKPKTEGCAKLGDTCEFAPGKLGTCVIRDGCTETSCFVCQSQH